MVEMVNLGAGVGSVAMTVHLAENGWRGPLVFCDTGCEKPGTYCYLDYFEREYLKPRDLAVTRLLPGSPYHCSMAQIPLDQYCLEHRVIPLLAVRWCSSRWKGRPLDRWAKEHGVSTQYIGFTVDEAHRADGKPEHLQFPLIDTWTTRRGAASLIRSVGLDEPPWSSCYFCPGQSIAEWHWLYRNEPALFDRAREMERLAGEAHNKRATLNNHYSLDEMRARRWEGLIEMDLSEWLPCACTA